MATLTVDWSVAGVFATYSKEATWAIVTCLLTYLLLLFTLLLELVILDI